jgi:hypothetical protein
MNPSLHRHFAVRVACLKVTGIDLGHCERALVKPVTASKAQHQAKKEKGAYFTEFDRFWDSIAELTRPVSLGQASCNGAGQGC